MLTVIFNNNYFNITPSKWIKPAVNWSPKKEKFWLAPSQTALNAAKKWLNNQFKRKWSNNTGEDVDFLVNYLLKVNQNNDRQQKQRQITTEQGSLFISVGDSRRVATKLTSTSATQTEDQSVVDIPLSNRFSVLAFPF